MQGLIPSALRRAALGGALALSLCGPALAAEPPQPGAAPAAAAAATAAPVLPPAGFVAPAEPRADETNAERARSQPQNNAPMWRAVRESGTTEGYSSLPAAESGVLIQRFTQYPGSALTNAGEAWRQVRNQWLIPYGGSLVLIVLLAIAIFYWKNGPLENHEPDTGRKIERFTALERAAHWTVAGSFSLLAISGLVMMFGKFLLLPLIGGTLFGWLTYALKNVHNFVGPLFSVGLVLMIALFIKDNLPKAHDIDWLKKGGGLLTGQHVPSHRFNAGEKVLFWGGVFVLGMIVSVSGFWLDKIIPGADYTRGAMQIAHMVHAVATVLMMAMFLGHIYMGTIGVKGALDAMRTGEVDEAWAKEHHELWYDDVKAGKIPARRSADAGATGRAATQA
ncbi:formate dehydrogenase subunit gamma [Caldimonas tepidiphila]|uniref:formate dehydrogenase subunit gamma n=1 Tax=Caldimonas tepidiphila TaxID=2315841 RepID=UPI000E5C40C8|nr:formate dehydrogenase subunit gamma [Caldimonas tepidiphila]